MIFSWTIRLLACAMVSFVAPLFFDLAISILGNLLYRTRRPLRAVRQVRLAVVIPAHNEEVLIASTLRSLLQAGCSAAKATAAGQSALQPSGAEWPVQVFVVAHNCSDRTAATAAQAGAVVVELNDPQQRGKGAALRCGFAAAIAANADAFLVIDADSIAKPNLIATMRATLDAGFEAVQCRYELEPVAGPGLQARNRLRVLAFRGVNVVRASGRAALGLSAGVFGNGFAVTAATLLQVPFTPDSICEDLEYHIQLICAGLPVRWVEQTAVYAPLSRQGQAQAMQEARWEGGRLRVAQDSASALLCAILRGSWSALGMLAEVWSLPLSRGLLTLLLMFLLPYHWLHLFALVCLAITVAYVLEAALLGDDPLHDLLALAGAPMHLLWKLAITPLVLLQARPNASWERTNREERTK